MPDLGADFVGGFNAGASMAARKGDLAARLAQQQDEKDYRDQQQKNQQDSQASSDADRGISPTMTYDGNADRDVALGNRAFHQRLLQAAQVADVNSQAGERARSKVNADPADTAKFKVGVDSLDDEIKHLSNLGPKASNMDQVRLFQLRAAKSKLIPGAPAPDPSERLNSNPSTLDAFNPFTKNPTVGDLVAKQAGGATAPAAPPAAGTPAPTGKVTVQGPSGATKDYEPGDPALANIGKTPGFKIIRKGGSR